MQHASTQVYQENRGRFPAAELEKFDRQWVAFNSDGDRVVAAAATIADLTDRLGAAKINIADVVIERIEIETDEIHLGAAEFM